MQVYFNSSINKTIFFHNYSIDNETRRSPGHHGLRIFRFNILMMPSRNDFECFSSFISWWSLNRSSIPEIPPTATLIRPLIDVDCFDVSQKEPSKGDPFEIMTNALNHDRVMFRIANRKKHLQLHFNCFHNFYGNFFFSKGKLLLSVSFLHKTLFMLSKQKPAQEMCYNVEGALLRSSRSPMNTL